MELNMFNSLKLFLKIFTLNNSDKMLGFVLLLTWVIDAIIYALVIGWKLALVFLSVSLFISVSFNLTVKVGKE